jgi:hypothetical protein
MRPNIGSMVRHWATKMGVESRAWDQCRHLFVCLSLLGYCFGALSVVNMQFSSIARRAMIPPRHGIDHSFIFFFLISP